MNKIEKKATPVKIEEVFRVEDVCTVSDSVHTLKPKELHREEMTLYFKVDTNRNKVDRTGKYFVGYIDRTDYIDEHFYNLIGDRKSNQHIKIRRWGEDRYLVTYCDGIYISEKHFFITREEGDSLVEQLEGLCDRN